MGNGYAICMGPCGACGKVFSFHPHKVPSVRDNRGVRQPICKACIDEANRIRPTLGLEPFDYPKDAYDPCPESEL